MVHRRNFFVTFSVFRCYIVEREKKAGGKSGQADSIRCRKQERGNTDVDNEILLKLYSLYQKELYLYLYSFCGDRHLAEDISQSTAGTAGRAYEHAGMALYGCEKPVLQSAKKEIPGDFNGGAGVFP